MLTLQSVSEIRIWRKSLPNDAPVVLVPTMGALHEGHAALIRRARELAGSEGRVVVSIFVNPLQFDRTEDLDTYPRQLEGDLTLCASLGADAVFTPTPEEIYHDDLSVLISETSLSSLLCGATRAGHFDGVCTVVSMLFHLTQPTAAIFGEKDYQQLAIIRRMVRDQHFDIDIIGHPIVREQDGLALSSRNVRLAKNDRALAPTIHEALELAKKAALAGEQSTAQLLTLAGKHLSSQAPESKVDYLEAVDATTLQRVSSRHDAPNGVVIAIAIFFGDVRLIDNSFIPTT